MKITGFCIDSMSREIPFNEIGIGSFFIVNNPEDNDIKIYVKLGNYFVRYKNSARVKSSSVNQLSNTQVNTLELFSQELKLFPESLTCNVIHGCLKCCNTKHDPILNGKAYYEYDESFSVVANSETLKVNLQLNDIRLTNHVTKNYYHGVVIRLGTNLYFNSRDGFFDNVIECSFGEKVKSEFEYAKVVGGRTYANFNFETRITIYDEDNSTVSGPYDLIDFYSYGRCEEGIIKSFCF